MSKFIKSEEVFGINLEKALSNVQILKLLQDASIHVGEINNIVSNVFEFDFIISALKNIEALTSARIEGTTGNLKDLYMEEALDIELKKELKLYSAINYKMAMGEVEDIIRGHKKVDLSLIRHLHKSLTENDPATTGEPGKFRMKDVIIRNSKLGDFYPATSTKVGEFMDDLVTQTAAKKDYPSLIQAAITHYQFEAIHPFEDGNGRTGRLLIVSQLLMNGTLKSAVLNLSQYFDANRDEYIAALRSVSDNQDYETWFIFFLTAIIEQSKHNINLIKGLREMKERNELLINENAHSPAALLVLNHSLNELYITTENTCKYLEKKGIKGDLAQMARNNIKTLEKLGILEKTNKKSGRLVMYTHSELMKKLTKK